MWDLSSPTRDRTHIPCIAGWIVNYWTTRKSWNCFLNFIFRFAHCKFVDTQVTSMYWSCMLLCYSTSFEMSPSYFDHFFTFWHNKIYQSHFTLLCPSPKSTICWLFFLWKVVFRNWCLPGEGNGSPVQHSCLKKSLDRGAWRAAVHGVAWLSTYAWGWREIDW